MGMDETDILLSRWARHTRTDATMLRWARDWQALEEHLSDDPGRDTLEAARRAYRQSSVLWTEEDAWSFLPLVRMFAERLSVTFDLAPSTYLVRRGSVDRLPETDPNVIQWRADEQAMDLPMVLQSLELYVTALRSSLCVAAWMRDHVEWQVYSPSDVRVLPAPDAPGDLQAAPVVATRVRLGIGEDGVQRADRWLCYTLRQDGRREAWLCEEDGRRVAPALFSDGSVPYGQHPVAIWSWEMPRRGSLWMPPPASLLSSQRGINLASTDLDHGMKYHAHPVRIRYGQPIAPAGGLRSAMAVGPGFEESFQDRQTGGIEFASPTLNAEQARKNIDSTLQKLAVMSGLPPDTFSTDSTVRNLGAMQEVKAELERIRNKRRPVVARLLARTFQAHRSVANAWADVASYLETQGFATVSRYRYDDDVDLRMEFIERVGVEDRQASAQARQLEIDAGLTSAVEEEMARSGATRAEAEATVRARFAAREVPRGAGA